MDATFGPVAGTRRRRRRQWERWERSGGSGVTVPDSLLADLAELQRLDALTPLAGRSAARRSGIGGAGRRSGRSARNRLGRDRRTPRRLLPRPRRGSPRQASRLVAGHRRPAALSWRSARWVLVLGATAAPMLLLVPPVDGAGAARGLGPPPGASSTGDGPRRPVRLPVGVADPGPWPAGAAARRPGWHRADRQGGPAPRARAPVERARAPVERARGPVERARRLAQPAVRPAAYALVGRRRPPWRAAARRHLGKLVGVPPS